MAYQPTTAAAPGQPQNHTNGDMQYNYQRHANYNPDIEANRHHQSTISQVPVPHPAHHQSTISQVRNPEFFKTANPGPLGLISFAITTFALGLYECGVGLPNSNAFGNVGPAQAVFGMAVFFGGAAQFIAGLLQFRVGNTFGCTLHCSYGAFWLAYAMFLIPSLGIEAAYNGDTRAYSVHLGIFNILWSLLTWLFFIAALRTNITILGVLFSLAMAFFLLAVANFIETTHTTSAVRVNRAGAAFAIISAILALYAGISGLMVEDTTPVRFPLGELPLRRPRSTEKHADKERVN